MLFAFIFCKLYTAGLHTHLTLVYCRYAPSKRWHIDTIMRVLTTVNVFHWFTPTVKLDHIHDYLRLSRDVNVKYSKV